jgi:hypothetical protein
MGIFARKCKGCGKKLVKKESVQYTPPIGRVDFLEGAKCNNCNSILCDGCYKDLTEPENWNYGICPYCGGHLGVMIA